MVVLATAITACGGSDDHDGARDLSQGLVTFHYALRPGLGYCVTAGMVVHAEIFGDESGRLGISGSRMEVGQRGVDTCVPLTANGTCLVEHVLPPRPLDADEAERFSGLFAHVRIGVDAARDCATADPCVIPSFHWTNRRGEREVETDASGGACPPRLSTADAQAITDALDLALR